MALFFFFVSTSDVEAARRAEFPVFQKFSLACILFLLNENDIRIFCAGSPPPPKKEENINKQLVVLS